MTIQSLKQRAKEGLDHLRLAASPPERELQAPAVDVVEREAAFVVRADVPGATRWSTEVFLTDDRTISIRARRTDSLDDDVADWAAQVVLPSPIDGDRVDANVVNGVLTIELGKRHGERKRIAISST